MLAWPLSRSPLDESRASPASRLILLAFSRVTGAGGPVDPVNLALNKPASSSSIENDEHNAAQANDGDSDTCWRADDEPEGGAEWWQVDLEKAADLGGCQICWPYDGKIYRYKVEGSADRKNWAVLSDQTRTTRQVAGAGPEVRRTPGKSAT